MRSQRFGWWIVVMIIVLAACAPSGTPTHLNINATPVAPAPELSVTKPASAPLARDAATEEVVPEATISSSTTVVIRVNPTPILLVPIQGNTVTPAATPIPLSREGWQTFTSATLGVAVDYPADWSVAEESDGATFTSPQGTTILLKAGGAGVDNNEFKIGNRRCTARTNTNNLTANVCIDTAPYSYSATFTLKSVDGSVQRLTLTTTILQTASVFEGMFNSIRPAK
jgi:hypothetical protein